MVTISSVINIDGDDNFNGNQNIDPNNIVYIQPSATSASRCILIEGQDGQFTFRKWLIGQTVGGLRDQLNAAIGYTLIVDKTILSVAFNPFANASGNYAINARRIYMMTDNKDGDAVVELYSPNHQNLLKFTFDASSASIATEANTTIDTIDNITCIKINGQTLYASKIVYFATNFVEKDIRERQTLGRQIWLTTPDSWDRILYAEPESGSGS